MENRLPQFLRVDNVMTFLEDNCVTFRGKSLNSTFLIVFERKQLSVNRLLFVKVQLFTK